MTRRCVTWAQRKVVVPLMSSGRVAGSDEMMSTDWDGLSLSCVRLGYLRVNS